MGYFQSGAIPSDAIVKTYNLYLVFLSYVIAVFASYVALDTTGRLQKESSYFSAKLWWLFGGALAMGAGIWTMHFVAMLALKIHLDIFDFDPYLTAFSFVIAVGASAFALFLLRNRNPNTVYIGLGGIILGIGIALMHYVGMLAMTPHFTIHYIPFAFVLSIIIAIVASEAALFLMHQSNQIVRLQFSLKLISALVMGAAICGMHFTAMWSAIIIPKKNLLFIPSTLGKVELAFFVTVGALLIMGVALAVANLKRLLRILHEQNEELAATQSLLEQKQTELTKVNFELQKLKLSVKEEKQRLKK